MPLLLVAIKWFLHCVQSCDVVSFIPSSTPLLHMFLVSLFVLCFCVFLLSLLSMWSILVRFLLSKVADVFGLLVSSCDMAILIPKILLIAC